jgi:predicted AAA+ superfamily ATPase
MHDGGLLDVASICRNLKVAQQTVVHFIDLFEATHLIYRLHPYGYGKEILRARYKVYLADAAIAPAVLLKDKTTFLNDDQALGIATETAVFKHLYARYYSQNLRFTYWRDKKSQEVDILSEVGEEIVPFEVKYRSQHTEVKDLKGLGQLCKDKNIERGYIITKSLDDFGSFTFPQTNTKIMRIPAPIFCYWMGESELNHTNYK